jgi:hypothetical protein
MCYINYATSAGHFQQFFKVRRPSQSISNGGPLKKQMSPKNLLRGRFKETRLPPGFGFAFLTNTDEWPGVNAINLFSEAK